MRLGERHGPERDCRRVSLVQAGRRAAHTALSVAWVRPAGAGAGVGVGSRWPCLRVHCSGRSSLAPAGARLKDPRGASRPSSRKRGVTDFIHGRRAVNFAQQGDGYTYACQGGGTDGTGRTAPRARAAQRNRAMKPHSDSARRGPRPAHARIAVNGAPTRSPRSLAHGDAGLLKAPIPSLIRHDWAASPTGH